MEILAKKLANNIAFVLGYDDEREAVIAYGLFAIFQTVFTIAAVFLLGLLIGATVESLIICLSASILRRSSGGAHAIAANLCSAIGIVYCAGTACITKYIIPSNSLVFSIVSFSAVFLISFFVIYIKAPVDTPNKPIKSANKIKRMRKGSFITLAFYLILSAGFFAAEQQQYLISLLFGISWQIFTMTKAGFAFIHTINGIYRILRKEV